MEDELKKMIYIKQNSICSELCDELIQRYENSEKYDGVTAGGLNRNVKTTTDYNIINNKEWDEVTTFLKKELQANYLIYKNNLSENQNYNKNQYSTYKHNMLSYNKIAIPYFLIQRYIQNIGRYVYHHDFMVDWKTSQYRIITFIWYLNDVSEGGETEFFASFKIKPEKGKLVLFPSSWTFPHCGKMPISDNKYIITGWLYVSDDDKILFKD